MTPDLERAARAIEDAHTDTQSDCLEVVRSVLLALREPSDDVAAAGHDALFRHRIGDGHSAKFMLRAMIEAILGEKPA